MTSQSSIAYQQIKDMIFRMQILPGDRLPEQQISAILSIGRTPIHDALRRLQAEGLVEIELNRGAVVKTYSTHEISEIGTVRLSQDILASQLAARFGSASDFDRLYKLAEECESAATSGNVYERIRRDADFHLEIARISQNVHLLRQQMAIYQQTHLIHIVKYTDVEESLAQICHHKHIVEAISTRDIKQIKRLSCRHIMDFYQLDPYIVECYDR